MKLLRKSLEKVYLKTVDGKSVRKKYPGVEFFEHVNELEYLLPTLMGWMRIVWNGRRFTIWKS